MSKIKNSKITDVDYRLYLDFLGIWSNLKTELYSSLACKEDESLKMCSSDPVLIKLKLLICISTLFFFLL